MFKKLIEFLRNYVDNAADQSGCCDASDLLEQFDQHPENEDEDTNEQTVQ